jgi:hypothetical protein
LVEGLTRRERAAQLDRTRRVFAVQGRGQGERVGVGFIVFGLVSFAVIMKVVYPTFRHGEETMYFAKY